MIYRLKWELDIDATSPTAAARKAQAWMDAGDTGWTFEVYPCDEQGNPEATPVLIDMGEILDNEWLEQNGPQI